MILIYILTALIVGGIFTLHGVHWLLTCFFAGISVALLAVTLND